MMATSAAATTLAWSSTQADDKPDDAGWIDAHSHIWPPEVDKYPLARGQTKADLKPPSFTDDELMKLAAPEGVKRVVLIQHSVYHLFDNSYLVDAVKRHPQRFRVVGMVDDRAREPGAAMRRLLKQGVTGFRITPFIRKDQPEKWLDTPGMQEMWKTGAETRQAMCCLINAADLARVDKMCQDNPDTPVVIDHFARIGIDGEMRDKDIQALCDLAKHKHTSVKVSAYYALGKKKTPHLELGPMIKRLLAAFGRERLMWASDSPYQIEPPNTYADSIALIRDRLDFLNDEDRQWLLRKTAEKVFFYA
jgi:predicted TIM-barrel fold metal-dependent hydrolase